MLQALKPKGFPVLKLEQKYFPFKKISLLVNEDRELLVMSSSLSNTTSVTIPIDTLTSRPTEYRHLKVVTISIFIISTLIALFSAYLVATTNNPDKIGMQALASVLIFGTFSFISLVKLQGAYKNLLIFNNKRTNDGVVFLSPNKPSKEEVQNFVNALEERIRAIEYGQNLTTSEMLVIYEKHLEFLLAEKVITEEEFEAILYRAKNKKSNKVVSIVSK